MTRSLSSALIKSIEYLSVPFAYPTRFGELMGKTLTRRVLVHELARLLPHRGWFASRGIGTVLDVGAYIGATAYAMRIMIPDVQVYSFEPLPDNFATLNNNLRRVGNFTAFNTALGDTQGTLEFHRSDFVASSSALAMGGLHRDLFPESATTTIVQVRVARLDDFLPQINLSGKVFLKMDVQGFEDAVLRGAPEILQRVDYIMTEISYQPLYEGQVLFDDLYELLKQAGFVFAGNFDTLLSPKDGAIIQSDALFMRPE